MDPRAQGGTCSRSGDPMITAAPSCGFVSNTCMKTASRHDSEPFIDLDNQPGCDKVCAKGVF